MRSTATRTRRPGSPLAARLASCPAEKLFLPVFILMELAAMLLIPFNGPPDEGTHYLQVWLLSTGQIRAEEYVYPENLLELFEGGGTALTDPGQSRPGFWDERVSRTEIRRGGDDLTEIYPFLSYAPQALAVFLARLFTDRLFILLYSARLGSMAVTALLFYHAVKRIPCGKYILMSVALLPVTLQEAASASCDGMTIAGVSLILAVLLSLIAGRAPLGRRTALHAGLLAIGAVLWKVFYLPALLMAALIPASAPEEKKNRRRAHAAAGAAALAALALWYLLSVRANMTPGSRTSSAVAKGLGLLAAPTAFVRLQLATIARFGLRWGLQLFASLGRLQRYSPAWLFAPFMAVFLAVWALDDRLDAAIAPARLRRRTAAALLAVFLICWLLLSGALLIWWTADGLPYIDGIQGRYFLPVLICPLLCVPSFRGLAPRRGLRPLLLGVLCAFSLATMAFLF